MDTYMKHGLERLYSSKFSEYGRADDRCFVTCPKSRTRLGRAHNLVLLKSSPLSKEAPCLNLSSYMTALRVRWKKRYGLCLR